MNRFQSPVAVWLLASLPAISIAAEPISINPLSRLNGIWQSRGQGILLDIEVEQYTLYDLTTISCIQTEQKDASHFFRNHHPVRLTDEQLQLTELGNVVDTRFHKLERLPERCADGGLQSSRDPQLNFDVFWQMFAENYPAFERRGIDWQQLRQQYRPQVTAQTTDTDLFELFGRMIQPLRDGHVRITDHQGRSIQSLEHTAAEHILQRDFERQTRIPDRETYFDQAIDAHYATITEHYLEGPIKTGVLENMFWGKLDDRTGYLHLGSFGLDIDETTIQLSAVRTAIRASMAEFIADMVDIDGLVIDLRLNPGGADVIAFEVASFFNDRERPVFSVRSAMPEQRLSPAVTAVLPVASGPRYSGSVALLTSGNTESAAEVFTLAMRELPQVTQVGDRTAGDLSNSRDKHLPNGWVVSVAPDAYRSQTGQMFEARGIPADAHAELLLHSDRVLATDQALEQAETLLVLDRTIRQRMQTANIPGLAATLVVNGERLWSRGYGYADRDQQRRATADTPFSVASVSKTVIGVALMQLVEQGRLSLETPINTLLPFALDNPKVDGEVIQVRHLVSHTSGLIDNPDVYNAGYVTESEAVSSLATFLRDYYQPDGALYDAQRNFAATRPGEHSQYSNIAPALVAYLVERVSGQTYDQYVEQHIFQPLAMSNSHYHLTQFAADTVAIPYGLENDGQFYHYPTYPDGLLRTSANDLAAYIGDLSAGRTLLSRTARDALWTPRFTQTPPVGSGVFWDVNTRANDTRVVGHNGADPGVGAELRLIPTLGVGAAVMINTDRVHPETGQLTEANTALMETFQDIMAQGITTALDQQAAVQASGAWYAPEYDGQGFHIEILPDQQAVVIWFGYDEQGQQRWIIGTGRVVGNRIDVANAYRTTGAVFGDGFDPANVSRQPWGQLVFELTVNATGDSEARLVYRGADAEDSGELMLTRLTEHGLPDHLQAQAMTGSWFDPAHDGEGLIVEALNEHEATVYWFTYTPQGQQAWLVGQGRIEGDRFHFPDLHITTADRSATGLKTSAVRQHWGSVTLHRQSCQHFSANYQGAFGSGRLNLQRLTTPVKVRCQP